MIYLLGIIMVLSLLLAMCLGTILGFVLANWFELGESK